MSQMFSKAQPTPTIPDPTPPPTMPDPNSPATLEARRKAIADASTGGRTATILTTAASRSGGTLAGSYAGNKMGSSS